jgi:hypothetical protein
MIRPVSCAEGDATGSSVCNGSAAKSGVCLSHSYQNNLTNPLMFGLQGYVLR